MDARGTVPCQFPQDFLPVFLPSREGFPQGPQHFLRLGGVMTVLMHFLDQEDLSRNALLAFSDVALGLSKVVPFFGRNRHYRAPDGLKTTITFP
jgi:hypothetical protein